MAKEKMIEEKQVISHLFNQFVTAEKGNTVSANAMGYLYMQVCHAIDGNLTIRPPEEKGVNK